MALHDLRIPVRNFLFVRIMLGIYVRWENPAGKERERGFAIVIIFSDDEELIFHKKAAACFSL
jgi:hypothetical protein